MEHLVREKMGYDTFRENRGRHGKLRRLVRGKLFQKKLMTHSYVFDKEGRHGNYYCARRKDASKEGLAIKLLLVDSRVQTGSAVYRYLNGRGGVSV